MYFPCLALRDYLIEGIAHSSSYKAKLKTELKHYSHIVSRTSTKRPMLAGFDGQLPAVMILNALR